MSFADGHAVQGQRAGLVHAQHGGRAQRLDGRHAAGEHMLLGNAPGAQGQENRQHHREFFRQVAMARVMPARNPLQPVAARSGR